MNIGIILGYQPAFTVSNLDALQSLQSYLANRTIKLLSQSWLIDAVVYVGEDCDINKELISKTFVHYHRGQVDNMNDLETQIAVEENSTVVICKSSDVFLNEFQLSSLIYETKGERPAFYAKPCNELIQLSNTKVIDNIMSGFVLNYPCILSYEDFKEILCLKLDWNSPTSITGYLIKKHHNPLVIDDANIPSIDMSTIYGYHLLQSWAKYNDDDEYKARIEEDVILRHE